MREQRGKFRKLIHGIDTLDVSKGDLDSIISPSTAPTVWQVARVTEIAGTYTFTVPNGAHWFLYGASEVSLAREHVGYANIRLAGTFQFTTTPGYRGDVTLPVNLYSDCLRGMYLPVSCPPNTTIQLVSQNWQAGDSVIYNIIYSEVLV